MKLFHLICLLTFFLTAVYGAEAQTFAPGSVSGGQKTSVSPWANKSVSATQSAPEEDDDDFNEEDFEDEDFAEEDAKADNESSFLTGAVKNFEDDNKEQKKYDNRIGQVVHFRFVDGKLEMDENEDRKILVYYKDYKLEKGLDNIVRCSMRIYVLNDLEEKISDLSFKLKWQKIGTSMQMHNLQPGVRTYSDIMLLGDGCYAMDKVPTIEINRCRVKGKTQEQCADAVKWFDAL